MQYVLLIYENEKVWADMSEAEKGASMNGYMEFTKSAKTSGAMLGGEPLQPVATAKSVRVRNGKTVVTDGPFAETKEQLGGFYLVEAKSDAEAHEIASRIPGAKTGTIEVRPVMKIPGM